VEVCINYTVTGILEIELEYSKTVVLHLKTKVCGMQHTFVIQYCNIRGHLLNVSRGSYGHLAACASEGEYARGQGRSLRLRHCPQDVHLRGLRGAGELRLVSSHKTHNINFPQLNSLQ